MAEWGLTLADYAEDPPMLLACNELAVDAFCCIKTQWRSGGGGPTGLDYGQFDLACEMADVPTDRRKEVFSAIRIMEGAALDEIYQDKE